MPHKATDGTSDPKTGISIDDVVDGVNAVDIESIFYLLQESPPLSAADETARPRRKLVLLRLLAHVHARDGTPLVCDSCKSRLSADARLVDRQRLCATCAEIATLTLPRCDHDQCGEPMSDTCVYCARDGCAKHGNYIEDEDAADEENNAGVVFACRNAHACLRVSHDR